MKNIFLISMIILACFLLIFSSQLLGDGSENNSENDFVLSEETVTEKKELFGDDALNNSYFVSDTVYVWDDSQSDWVVKDKGYSGDETLKNSIDDLIESQGIYEINWDILQNLEYKLKYFPDLELEMYSPIFPEAIKSLDKKKVIIKGFVIPFDVEQNLIALSLNSFAACFFCGNAGPASVISLYTKDEEKYNMDDFIKFQGVLHLNYNDPNEFYFILRDAIEIRE